MDQQKHGNQHNRKQFQIDRVAFFSDAVIAIAITLMVLEIKIPPLGEKTLLKDIIAKYGDTFLIHAAALFLCFTTIGNLWIKHHELYEHVIDYNRKLIKRNLYFLLTIVVLPISISFLFEEGSPTQLKLLLFFINLCLCNIAFYSMLLVIFHQRNNFSALTERRRIIKNKQSTLLSAIVFASAAALVLFNVRQFYMPFFIEPSIRIVKRVIAIIKNRKPRNGKFEKKEHEASIDAA